mgnify:CR=1 FL=1
MKSSITRIVEEALGELPEYSEVLEIKSVDTAIERTRDPRHGDFTTNIAMRLAKNLGATPKDVAKSIISKIPDSNLIDAVDIAEPGFINFWLSQLALHHEIALILRTGSAYGQQPAREKPKILLEFVSANPTGPLHVGHGRHASYGATLGNLLEAAGYQVDREYYVNDAGRQMDILSVSVLLRMLEQSDQPLDFPKAGYHGDYIRNIARIIDHDVSDINVSTLFDNMPFEDKEAVIDALIENSEKALGVDRFTSIRQQSLEFILADIKDDLEGFGVTFDSWVSEQSLTNGLIDEALTVLKERDMTYEKDGNIWFRATRYGDNKDRVVVRANGKTTYFASDIAYHYGKRERGYDLLIDVLGSDHHGYVTRVKAGLEAIGYAGDSLEVPLVQFVTLYRGGEKVQMSTRSGEFVTLRELREEVGQDAARLFYVMRSNDQHLDFDLELAKSRSTDNPVYYIQYAHARIESVFRQLSEKSLDYDETLGMANFDRLTEAHEKALMSSLSRYPEVIALAASKRSPQHLVHYLRNIANELHSYYNAHKFIVDDDNLRNARLALITAARTVISSGLSIIGVAAPEKM